MTLWNLLPLYPSPWGFLDNSMKFSTVFGTVFPKSPISILPSYLPSILISNHTYIDFVIFNFTAYKKKLNYNHIIINLAYKNIQYVNKFKYIFYYIYIYINLF